MKRARGDIKLFPSECGPWRVRFLCKVVQIVGLVGFYSDVVVEKWSSKDEICMCICTYICMCVYVSNFK